MAARLGPTLSEVLDGVWASSLPVAEKRRLCARAVTAPLLAGVPVRGDSGDSAVVRIEEVLVEVAKAVGRSRLDVGAAKAILRSRGEEGKALAARLGKLSKARNASAHPDVTLAADVRGWVLAEEGAMASSASVGTNTEEEEEDKKVL